MLGRVGIPSWILFILILHDSRGLGSFHASRYQCHHSSRSAIRSSLPCTASADALADVILIEKTRYENRRLYWDQKENVLKKSAELSFASRPNRLLIMHSYLNGFLRNCFMPVGTLTQDYNTYTAWRIMQRFLSATTSVFGTQSLLLAIGGDNDVRRVPNYRLL